MIRRPATTPPPEGNKANSKLAKLELVNTPLFPTPTSVARSAHRKIKPDTAAASQPTTSTNFPNPLRVLYTEFLLLHG
jgi:hypothetical protein